MLPKQRTGQIWDQRATPVHMAREDVLRAQRVRHRIHSSAGTVSAPALQPKQLILYFCPLSARGAEQPLLPAVLQGSLQATQSYLPSLEKPVCYGLNPWPD